MNNLKIINADFNLEFGFFWVEFDNGKSLQCCLVSEDESYVDKIDENNMGSDEGLSFDNNDWAISDDFSWGWVNSMLIKEAKRIGVEII